MSFELHRPRPHAVAFSSSSTTLRPCDSAADGSARPGALARDRAARPRRGARSPATRRLARAMQTLALLVREAASRGRDGLAPRGCSARSATFALSCRWPPGPSSTRLMAERAWSSAGSSPPLLVGGGRRGFALAVAAREVLALSAARVGSTSCARRPSRWSPQRRPRRRARRSPTEAGSAFYAGAGRHALGPRGTLAERRWRTSSTPTRRSRSSRRDAARAARRGRARARSRRRRGRSRSSPPSCRVALRRRRSRRGRRTCA